MYPIPLQKARNREQVVHVVVDQQDGPSAQFWGPLLLAVDRRHGPLVDFLCSLLRGQQQGKVEREGAALPRSAPEPDLAAQQPSELATDRQPQTCAAERAARRGIRLLEGLEDQFVLFPRDADAGVGDGEREELRASAQ